MSEAPTRAVVLGGGGPVGRGWQAGLLTGLSQRGTQLGTADLVVGTSAGAILGALLCAGADLAPVPERALRMGQILPGLIPSRDAAVRAGFGQAALTAETMTEDESLSRATLAPLSAVHWPSQFAATTVNARTGQFRVFRALDGAPLLPAVAASAALPGVYPAITVAGEQYVDGGVRSMLNADLAAGFQAVTLVSCFPLEPSDETDIAELQRTGARVLTVLPEERLRGKNMLDLQLVGRAYEIGLEQAQAEVERLEEVWSGSSL